MDLSRISVCILAKNAGKRIAHALDSVSEFGEVIVLDNESSDDTVAIARTYPNVRVESSPFIGFGPLKNLAISFASHDWILSLDSDEVLENNILEAIRNLAPEEKSVYAFRRKNHYGKTWIKTCGWYPDYVLRLFHRGSIRFNENRVHESLEIPKGSVEVKLKADIKHYPFEDIAHLLDKMQYYSTLWAQQNLHRPSPPPPPLIVLRSFWTFMRNYFLKAGVLSGYKGFVISICNALGTFFKYMKLYEFSLANPSSVSLIVTTYNQKERLALVLDSILEQTCMPREVLIADDGSREDTRELILKYQSRFPIHILHIWQEDCGYRLARSRNQAILNAQGEYIILVDGDMILSPSFVQDHLRFARKRCFVQGGRILLNEAKTQDLMQKKCHQKAFENKALKNHRNFLLAKIIFYLSRKNKKNAIQKNKLLSVRGCNMAFYKEDAYRINGFDENFVGWGREDSEFVVRFLNANGEMRKLKFYALAYHLHHQENSRAMLDENHQIYTQSVEQNKVWCENGLEKSNHPSRES